MRLKVLSDLKWLIWLYFWLLIFEGALRKWILPELSAPLLIIRDPLVLWIYFLAVKRRIFPQYSFIYGLGILAFITTFASIIVGLTSAENNMIVTLFGLRTNFLHLPLIFLIPKVFNAEDVKKMGKWILLLSLPMAVLMVFQFVSPPTAFINTTAGGEGTQIGSALEKIRPPGTFSFVSAIAQYYSLVTAFLLQGLTKRKVYSYKLLIPAGFGLVLALAVSGSRLTILSVGLVVITWLVTFFIKPAQVKQLYKFLIAAVVIGIGLSFLPFFREGLEVITLRWTAASASEADTGGMVGRVAKSFTEPFGIINQIPFLGHGLGMGTNVGSMLLTGKVQFLLAEGEWSRILFESGPILGLLYIFFRVFIAGWMGWLCLKRAASGKILPLLLWGACAYLLVLAQFSRTSDIGFTVLGAGLCLAARRTSIIPVVSNPPPQLHESVAHR